MGEVCTQPALHVRASLYLRAMRLAAAAVAVPCLALVLGACSSTQPDAPTTRTESFHDVTDSTNSDSYDVEAPVTVTTDEIGTRMEMQFSVLHANGTSFSPRATVTFADGGQMICAVDDVRRTPNLVDSLDTWDFACDRPLPDDASKASVVIVDDYGQ